MRATFDDYEPELSEVDYALGRFVDRLYLSRSFPMGLWTSRDYRQPTRYLYRVFDTDEEIADQDGATVTIENIRGSAGGRVQIQLQVVKDPGSVREILVQRVTAGQAKLEVMLKLNREESQRLISMIQALPHIPVEGEHGVRVDDSLLQAVFESPDSVAALYERSPQEFRQVIQSDEDAADLIALASRRKAVEEFHQLLENHEYFAEASEAAGGEERIWQTFFERNPWILGIGMSGQFFTSWDESKLEQTVAGYSVAGAGKRADALLATNGRVRSLVFGEFKPHTASLVGTKSYRSEVYAPSVDLVSGVAQVQVTLNKAAKDLHNELAKRLEDGSESREVAQMLRPRSYLVMGSLSEFVDEDGNFHRQRFESFELYRRNLYEPEILTFDEVLARAEWQIALAEAQ